MFIVTSYSQGLRALTHTFTWNIFKGNQSKIIKTGQAIKKKISKVTSIHTLFKKILHEKLLNLVTYDRHANPNYKEGSLPVNLKGRHEKSTKNQWWKRHGEMVSYKAMLETRLNRISNSYPPQCSCLENPMDRGAWQATVHEVAKNQTQQSN